MSALGLTLAAKDKNAIRKKVFRFGPRLSNKDAFTICTTAKALGIPLFKLNSFYDIKFQDKTSAIKKWLVAHKDNFRQPNKPQVNINWKSIIWLIHTPNYI